MHPGEAHTHLSRRTYIPADSPNPDMSPEAVAEVAAGVEEAEVHPGEAHTHLSRCTYIPADSPNPDMSPEVVAEAEEAVLQAHTEAS